MYPANANQQFPLNTSLGLRINHHKSLGRNAKRAEPSHPLVSSPVGLLDNVTTLSTRLAFTMLDIPRHLPPPDREPAHRSASQPEAAESAGKPTESCRKLRTRSESNSTTASTVQGQKACLPVNNRSSLNHTRDNWIC